MKMLILPLLNISLFLPSLVSDLSRSFARDNIALLNSNEKKPGHCTMRYAKVNYVVCMLNRCLVLGQHSQRAFFRTIIS